MAENKVIHGHCRDNKCTKEYNTWARAKRKSKTIYECDFDEEFDKFEGFLKYIGESPSKYHQLFRINMNDGYIKGNIEWRLRERKNKRK